MRSAGRLQYTLSGKSGEAAKLQRNIQEVLLPQITHHKGFRHLYRIPENASLRLHEQQDAEGGHLFINLFRGGCDLIFALLFWLFIEI